eukprot:5837989-Prymnesium_polylepis.1
MGQNRSPPAVAKDHSVTLSRTTPNPTPAASGNVHAHTRCRCTKRALPNDAPPERTGPAPEKITPGERAAGRRMPPAH